MLVNALHSTKHKVNNISPVYVFFYFLVNQQYRFNRIKYAV